ncbi:MAG: glycosyltransferase family 2 protein [Lachnospiraceae bacterium]|nr:glycosyltransferase family 2 protein [Lachnospiraceae bacterium]MBQ9233685.1 glycosyltransferase family 2 protein [Lachnospiraceae bacterium]
MKKLSFVIPCYRSEQTLTGVVDDIYDAMKEFQDRYSFEIILVNDCSPDGTYKVIKELAKKHDNITGINLAKNFGQQGALMAGFHKAAGDAIVCLDDDGQTPPSEVGKLIAKYEEGYDVVYSRYTNKKHSFFRNFGSFVNDKMAVLLIGKPKELYASSYYIVDRFVVDEVIKYNNPYPYILGLILRTTNNIANVDIIHKAREVGESGYNMKKLLGLWLNGFTSFSIVPLRIATGTGVTISFLSLIYIIYIVVRKLVNPDISIGWSSTMSAILFVGGVIMCMLGMLGEYIGRIYIGLNNSPQYVVRETTDDDKDITGKQ